MESFRSIVDKASQSSCPEDAVVGDTVRLLTQVCTQDSEPTCTPENHDGAIGGHHNSNDDKGQANDLQQLPTYGER